MAKTKTFSKLVKGLPKLLRTIVKFTKSKFKSNGNNKNNKNNKNNINNKNKSKTKKILLFLSSLIEQQSLLIEFYSYPSTTGYQQNNNNYIINNANLSIEPSPLSSSSSLTISQKQINDINRINNDDLSIEQSPSSSSLSLSSTTTIINQQQAIDNFKINNVDLSIEQPSLSSSSPTLIINDENIDDENENINLNNNNNDDENNNFININNDEEPLKLLSNEDQPQTNQHEPKYQHELIQKQQQEQLTQQQMYIHHHQAKQPQNNNLNLLHIDQTFLKNQYLINDQQNPKVSVVPSIVPLYDFMYSIKFQSDFIKVPKPILLQDHQVEPVNQFSLQKLYEEEQQYQTIQQNLYQEQSYNHHQQQKRKNLLSKNLEIYQIDQDFIKNQIINNRAQVSFAPSILNTDKLEYSIKFQSDALLQSQQPIHFKYISQEELIDCDRYLGSGQFCHVFEAMYKCLPVAVKVPIRNDQSNIQSIRSEIEIIKKLVDHPNVVKYYGFTTQGQITSIVSELMKKDLKSIIFENPSPPSLSQRIKYAIDICHGVKEIHRVGIIHRDLKLDNIMLDSNGTAKITDFGLSDVIYGNKIQDGNSGAKGTPIFMAPEVLINLPFDNRIDIFSIGIILYELFTCKEAYSGYNGCFEEFRNDVVVKGFRPIIPPHFPMSLKSLMAKCWDADPERRPSINQIIYLLNSLSYDC